MITELAQFMVQSGFEKITTNLPEFIFFYRQERQSVNTLMIIDYRAGLTLTGEQFFHLKESLRKLFAGRGVEELHILSVIICEDPVRGRELGNEDRFCWQIDPRENRLIIYEDKVPDFYGIKELIEEFLDGRRNGTEDDGESKTENGRGVTGNKMSLPVVNIVLVAVNVILYLICTWGTDLLYNKGDLAVAAVIGQHEYYRIFTSMFLHASVEHLFSNMLVLYFLGEIVEKELGHIRYAVLYLLCGIGAAAASMMYQYRMVVPVGSIGASGAIYGILGALLWLVLVHKGRYREATLPRMLFFLLYSIYSGFQAANVDNAAHIGGLTCGFIVMIFLWKRSRMNED